jgi:hypothetical protein
VCCYIANTPSLGDDFDFLDRVNGVDAGGGDDAGSAKSKKKKAKTKRSTPSKRGGGAQVLSVEEFEGVCVCVFWLGLFNRCFRVDYSFGTCHLEGTGRWARTRTKHKVCILDML